MTLEERIMQLEAENARLKESLVKSSEVIIKKDEKIASLEDQLYWLRKKVFGQMSEKHLPVDPAQLSLFSTEAITDEQKAEAEVPLHYKMNSSGLLLRESVMDVEQVEYFYGSPRNYLFYMNRLSGEEWNREQEKESSELISLDKIEHGINLQDLSMMKRNELGRENYSTLSDMMLCMHIDNEILPRYGVQSVYQLTEQQKKEKGNTLWKTVRAGRDQIIRCLVMK